MTENTYRTHPLIVVAATAVILTCLLAIGIMTGIIPSPLTKNRVETQARVEAPALPAPPPASERSSLADDRTHLLGNRANFAGNGGNGDGAAERRTNPRPTPRAERERERPAVGATRSDAPERAVGSTRSDAPERTVGHAAPPARVAATCHNCGTVTSVRSVTRQGEAGVVGPLAGSAIGGLVGSQIGGGSGKAAATIIGAAGGAAVGTEIERRQKATTSHIVNVRLNDGTTRSFTYDSAPGYREGDRVRVVEGRLVRDS